jgi:hypothetical protein
MFRPGTAAAGTTPGPNPLASKALPTSGPTTMAKTTK